MVGYTRGFFDLAPQATWTRATFVPDIRQTVPFAAAGVLTETWGKLQALVYDILPPEEGCWEAGIEFSVANKTVGS